MEAQKPCCPAAAARMIRKLTLSDGSQFGIVNLDRIMDEVARLKLADEAAIKRELLARIKADNYVEAVVEKDYAKALFAEYERRYMKEPKLARLGRSPRTA